MFIKRFCARERQTLLALQRFNRVPTFYPETVPTGIAMKRYDLDLFDAMDMGIVPTPLFARRLFGFLGELHDDVGMFHGDIKPENICMNMCVLEQDGVDLDSWVLVDWESARTHGATFTGPYTPDYMPPGEAPSASADVYSAAVTLLVAKKTATRAHRGGGGRGTLGETTRRTPAHREGSRRVPAVGGYALNWTASCSTASYVMGSRKYLNHTTSAVIAMTNATRAIRLNIPPTTPSIISSVFDCLSRGVGGDVGAAVGAAVGGVGEGVGDGVCG